MGDVEDFFDPAEFRIEIEELPDGGCIFHFDLTGKTKLYVERMAAKEGMTAEEYLRRNMLQDFSANEP